MHHFIDNGGSVNINNIYDMSKGVHGVGEISLSVSAFVFLGGFRDGDDTARPARQVAGRLFSPL